MVRACSTIMLLFARTIYEPCPYASPLGSWLLGTPVFCRCRDEDQEKRVNVFLSESSTPNKAPNVVEALSVCNIKLMPSKARHLQTT
jgi:hypothetical protein